MQVLASQLHFLANKNAELAIPPLFWPVNCIKIGGHVALPSDPTVYSLYCGHGSQAEKLTNQESRIFKFCFQALHVSREIYVSRITKNIFFKSRFTVNEMI